MFDVDHIIPTIVIVRTPVIRSYRQLSRKIHQRNQKENVMPTVGSIYDGISLRIWCTWKAG